MKPIRKIVSIIIALCIAVCAISCLSSNFSINILQKHTYETDSATEYSVQRGEEYYLHDDVAQYIHLFKELPPNYITKSEARKKGWKSGNPYNVFGENVFIGGDIFRNLEKKLPEGIEYFECDVDDYFDNGNRNSSRLIYTADGKVYFTKDHYESFEELY